MDMNMFYGILIPFVGTSAGAACVFFMKKDLNQWVQRCLTGFAAGVMVAASVWSLLIPAIEQSGGMGKLSFIPAAAGFWAGVLFLLLLDHIIPHLHQQTDKAEGPKSNLQRTTMLVLAVTLHNIPEGMAVGVVYAGYLTGNAQITLMGALVLSLGIAIQNGKDEGFCGRRFVWKRGTGRRSTDDYGRGTDRAGTAVSLKFCGGGDALCGGRGTDSGDVRRRTLEYRYHFLCSWIFADDGPGCGAGVKAERGNIGM